MSLMNKEDRQDIEDCMYAGDEYCDGECASCDWLDTSVEVSDDDPDMGMEWN